MAPDGARLRRVRVIRDYGMYDRREAPQFFPDVQPVTTPLAAIHEINNADAVDTLYRKIHTRRMDPLPQTSSALDSSTEGSKEERGA